MSIIYEPRGRAREYGALAANLYRGCAHGCLYCYAPAACRRKPGDFHVPAIRKDILDKLSEDVRKQRGHGERVLLCFSCDPYQPLEETAHITSRAIDILHAGGYTLQILTKGGLRAAGDFDKYKATDAFATTLTFIRESDSRHWEPGAALPDERLEALALAHEKGITTWASLEPVIDPKQSLALIEATLECVDEYRIGPLNYNPIRRAINWGAFTREAVATLEAAGKAYYLKRDLCELAGVTWHERTENFSSFFQESA